MNREISILIKKEGEKFILYCDELKIEAEGLTVEEAWNDFMQQMIMDVKSWNEYEDLPDGIKSVKKIYAWLLEGII